MRHHGSRGFPMPEPRALRPHAVIVPATVVIAACLSSCVQQPIATYSPTFTGPSARLLMRAALQPGEIYGVYTLAGADDCTRPLRVGSGNATTNPTATTIAAGKVSTLDIIMAKPDHTTCKLRWSFVPVANRSYLVRARTFANGCAALVLDATDPDEIKPDPTARRRNPTGQTCMPMATAPTFAQLEAMGHGQGDKDLPVPMQPSTGADRMPEDDGLKGLIGH
jgi:hypothetical protein